MDPRRLGQVPQDPSFWTNMDVLYNPKWAWWNKYDIPPRASLNPLHVRLASHQSRKSQLLPGCGSCFFGSEVVGVPSFRNDLGLIKSVPLVYELQ